jgi:peptide/nickel transport system substrate-binding protein
MKKHLKKVLLLFLVLCMAAAVVGCGKKSQKATTKDELVVALPGEPSTLDPYAHSLYYGFIPATLIFNTLVEKDENGEFQPELATEWNFTDNTTIVFKLRDDVTFSNGNKFTAEDVRYTLQKAVESTFSNSLFNCIDVDNTKIINDYEIEIKLKYAYAPLLDLLSSFRGGILDHISYQADPDGYGHEPIGTGPMKIGNWISGDRIELEANENYWGKPLAYKKCVFRVIVEASSRTIDLETGGVDIAVEIPFSDWSRVKDNSKLSLVTGQTNLLASLVFNISYDTFKDERVRKALAYGIDRDALVKTVWEGTADVADSYYAKNLLGYKSEGLMKYDAERAKALLAEAGYPNGFNLKYTTYQTTLNQTFAEVLQSMWRKIGVNVTIDIVDLATFTAMNNGGKLTAALLTPAVAIADPSAALLLWPITRTISLRHNDRKIQDLLDAGSSTYDTAKRVEIYQKLQDYLFEKTYSVPVAYTKFAFGAQASVQGFPFEPSQVPDLTRVYFD